MTTTAGPLVVLGDALLDRDVEGSADRLAPDAPAPVVEHASTTHRPGGAALAAVLAAREGHDVHLITAVGDDEAGEILRDLLADRVTVHRLRMDGGTRVKTRICAGGRPLVRVDEGRGVAVGDLPRGTEALLEGAAAALVSDYGAGVTGLASLRRVVARCAAHRPVVWDPHPRGAPPVAGLRLITPNAAEARLLSGIEGDDAVGVIGRRASSLVERFAATAVSVTCGARGAVVSTGGDVPLVVPAPEVRCIDACGAGDQFAAAATAALADGGLPSEAVVSAVRRAAAFVANGGAIGLMTPPGPPAGSPGGDVDPIRRVRETGGVVVATGGCFDLLHAGHISLLESARRLGDLLVVALNSDESVRRLKGPRRPIVGQRERQRVLEALRCVDQVVVFDEETPVGVIDRVRPDVWVKGGDYRQDELVEAQVVQRYGGSVVLLPYLDGCSTSTMVQAINTR